MKKTILSVPVDEMTRRWLRKSAGAAGQTVSAFVRDILRRAKKGATK